MIKRIVASICMLISFGAFAQPNHEAVKKRMMDSIKSVYLNAYALKYPVIRQASVSQQFIMPGRLRTKLDGNDLLKGRYRVAQTYGNLNIPVIEWGKNRITASIGAIYQSFHIEDVDRYNTQFGLPQKETDKTILNPSVTYTRNDSLFGKPVILNVSASSVFNGNFSRQKFVYTGIVFFVMKRTPVTSLSIGGVFIGDPSATIPFAPLVSYWRNLKSIKADFFVDFPYRVALRKELSRNISLTALSELSGTQAFFNLQTPFPEKSISSTLDLKGGMLLEYQFSKKAVFSISGGLFKTLSSKIAEQNKKINDDYFVNSKNEMVPYVNVGVSLLPFWKGFR